MSSAAKVISHGATHSTTTTVSAKNATCLSAINPSCWNDTLPVLISVLMTLSRITPITSSATAAPRIDAPSFVSRRPASFKTATEIDTDVAENTTPMNSDDMRSNPNTMLTPPMMSTGATTPMHATMSAALE